MGTIDIISLTGLTAIDGSLVSSGATIKFETLFLVGVNDVEIRLKIYRSRELFENGFQTIQVYELPNDFRMSIPDEEYYTITPFRIYQLVNQHLNMMLGGEFFELKIILNE